MRTRHIKQATSEDCLFKVLAAWCRTGAGEKSHSLKIITAFVSGTGVSAIAPLLDVFLADGNSANIIFGVDRNGTDREAVRQLYALKRAYIEQLGVRVFNAPSAGAIFHPKLYIYDRGSEIDFVVGSSNLTSGGLASNFEAYSCTNKCLEVRTSVLMPFLFGRHSPIRKTHYQPVPSRIDSS